MASSIMKSSLIKYYISAFLLLLIATKSKAQWIERLKPDYVVLQHAGSIGYLNVGAGYDLFRNNRGNIELNFGIVPENKGGPLHILSTKFAYRPFEIKVKDKVKIYPFNPGAFLSYHLDKQFSFQFDRDQYEKGYYPWPSALRAHISVSNEVKFKVKKLKDITLYSEFNASDLYLVSLFYINNRESLSPADIIKLGIGIKVGF